MVQVDLEKMIFRKTNDHTGRRIAVTPENSLTEHLAYGRIILNQSKSTESFSAADRETGLICLSGEATITVDEEKLQLGQFDAVYIPRDSSVTVSLEWSTYKVDSIRGAPDWRLGRRSRESIHGTQR